MRGDDTTVGKKASAAMDAHEAARGGKRTHDVRNGTQHCLHLDQFYAFCEVVRCYSLLS